MNKIKVKRTIWVEFTKRKTVREEIELEKTAKIPRWIYPYRDECDSCQTDFDDSECEEVIAAISRGSIWLFCPKCIEGKENERT